jgi:hypothetical protein
MDFDSLGPEAWKTVQEILGYLNFSSGAADSQFLKNVNDLFGWIEAGPDSAMPAWKAFHQVLGQGLVHLRGCSDAFRHVEQTEAVLPLIFDRVLPEYRRFHRDLLFHQTDDQLFQPLFIGRVCEAVLQQGGPWDQADRILPRAIGQLNDYLGYRPVAVLRTEQKIQAYAHEWVRPIPLYIRGVGVAVGRYRELVEKALAILETTDTAILFRAFFSPEMLDELAMDTRAYDFDHPNNKRPNYLFGQWDMGQLDLSGRCRRFVLQQVALEAMLERVEKRGQLPREEVLFEAASVLAGTMLMGAGVSGNRPDAHDSTVTLASLVQRIASYRDEFYEQLLSRMQGRHGERLRAEAASLRQPFGGSRQHFNQYLARRRADQLQHVHLAQIFARMGCTEAADRQVRIVPVPSSRMRCDIQCRLAAAHLEIDRNKLEQAAKLLPEIEDLLHRAIECGAMADPWNILGFGGQYSLFPAPENSIYDFRIDELLATIGDIFALAVRLQKEAAAAGKPELANTVSQILDQTARWWDKYAAHEIGGVEKMSGRETKESADQVAEAIRAWHQAGTAAGDLFFWREYAQQFHSPKAYSHVVETLLEHHDLVAAMALLVHWLSEAEDISLVEETNSFHELAMLWMEELWQSAPQNERAASQPRMSATQRWALTRKYFDYLEANAEDYWRVPQFELSPEPEMEEAPENQEADGAEDESDDLFRAAYEGVSYRDSTDDGFEGDIFDTSEDPSDVSLVLEAERIVTRLYFLITLGQLWKMAAIASLSAEEPLEDRDNVLEGWLKQALINHQQLLELLTTVHRYRIPPPRGTHESLVEYDRRRSVRDTLLEQIITAYVETEDAGRLIRAAMDGGETVPGLRPWEEPAGQALRAALHGDIRMLRKIWHPLSQALVQQPLLYVALNRGGNPLRVAASRSILRVLQRLLTYMPRLGLLRESCWLLETIQDMELDHPVGPGAVTEFDRVFELGCKAIVHCLVVSSQDWQAGKSKRSRGQSDADLIACLEETMEVLLRSWLTHSRGVRLSVLETVNERGRWQALKRFIQRYGRDLFTQHFMNLGNLRAILHEGVDRFLNNLAQEPGAQDEFRLIAELGGPLSRDEAERWLGVAIEAVVENYSEYVDYNSTTTQSDRGDMLHTLLDFLRLQVNYDRVAWNLRPVVLAHEVMVRCGRDSAAKAWRQAVAQRTADIAEDFQERLLRLNKKYGMRLPSVAERLDERFVRSLAVDQLRALVKPAIDGLRSTGNSKAFAQLEREITRFTKEVAGAGFNLPGWLEALEQEVERAETGADDDDQSLDPLLQLPQVRLSREEARREIQSMIDGE